MESKINQPMKNKIINFNPHSLLLFCIGLSFFTGCAEEFIPVTQEENQQYVVEGFIESGENSIPAFVILTRSIPFLSTIDLNTFDGIFVNDANVTVSDGTTTVTLTELCLEDLPEDIREIALQILGLDPDSAVVNLCVYFDLLDELDRKEGGKYDLKIEVEEDIITATTTIPDFVPLFNLRWEEPPGEPSDTLARLFVTINDPIGESNYYRYLTEENNGGFDVPFSSVVDDPFFDGKEFEFPLDNAGPRSDSFDSNSFGLYFRGDSIRIKWMNIDEAHFEFWTTLEFARNNAGPFSSISRVTSNVDGALGVWGGYAIGIYSEIVPF